MKEYYPADYARLKQYVAKGNVSGRLFGGGGRRESAQRRIDHPPGLVRNTFYRSEFGKAVRIHAAGLLWLSRVAAYHFGARRRERIFTQKSHGIRTTAAALIPSRRHRWYSLQRGLWRPGWETVLAHSSRGYGSRIRSDLSKPPRCQHRQRRGASARKRLAEPHRLGWQGDGHFADYHYVGTGDIAVPSMKSRCPPRSDRDQGSAVILALIFAAAARRPARKNTVPWAMSVARVSSAATRCFSISSRRCSPGCRGTRRPGTDLSLAGR